MEEITVVVVGDHGVGKTKLLRSLTQSRLEEPIKTTIGVDFYAATIDDKQCYLRFWEICGGENFSFLKDSFLPTANFVYCVFSFKNTVEESISSILKHLEAIHKFASKAQIIIIGTHLEILIDTETYDSYMAKLIGRLDTEHSVIALFNDDYIAYKSIIDKTILIFMTVLKTGAVSVMDNHSFFKPSAEIEPLEKSDGHEFTLTA